MITSDFHLNADLSKCAIMLAADAQWSPSPAPGVSRRMLDRIGGEVARATSIVRYEAGARFPEHKHERGEEFFVLDGVFSDPSGNFGAGSYVRNPPGTSHAPWTDHGCLLFVKLRQMRADDRALVRIDTNTHGWIDAATRSPSMTLYEGPEERVALHFRRAGVALLLTNTRGLEILVLSGRLACDLGAFVRHDWIRLPPGENFDAAASEDCLLWTKDGVPA